MELLILILSLLTVHATVHATSGQGIMAYYDEVVLRDKHLEPLLKAKREESKQGKLSESERDALYVPFILRDGGNEHQVILRFEPRTVGITRRTPKATLHLIELCFHVSIDQNAIDLFDKLGLPTNDEWLTSFAEKVSSLLYSEVQDYTEGTHAYNAGKDILRLSKEKFEGKPRIVVTTFASL